MKIAVVGAGFAGLTASLKLLQKGHHVELFEKENTPGGLAIGVKLPNFAWTIEKHYHHLFTNDSSIIDLVKELDLTDRLMIPSSLTSIYYDDKIYSFNSPSQFLTFSPLSLPDRLRLILISVYLKILPQTQAIKLEKYSAVSWIKKYYGKKIFDIVWYPLLAGKFSSSVNSVNMAWFWARIKKRTFKLIYIKGGFSYLAQILDQKIKSLGGKIHYQTSFSADKLANFDKTIITVPTSLFTKMFPYLPGTYKESLESIPHLHALNLMLILKEKFLKDNTYWLNINDRKLPFIAVVEHTNFIDSKYYNNNHIVYVANYLPPNHPYLKMSKEQIYQLYLPHLKKINPNYNFELCTLNFALFMGPFAQPLFPLNYSKIMPSIQTPIENVYLANMDMVYPWDRGTNYAVELGDKVAQAVDQSSRMK